ncbi:MAG: ABC transporter permease subunit [Actinomycetota bacterium]|nr:ABC transporter permease subunit [Actinomycetota bacterium]
MVELPRQGVRLAHDPGGGRDPHWALAPLGLSGPGFGNVATWLVFSYLWLPYMIIPVYAGLERIPDSLLDASGDLGGGPGTTLRRVVLPLALPAVVAGSIFTFTLTFGDYITPSLVSSTQFIGNVVYSNVGVANNLPLAAAFATVPVVVMVLYLLIARQTWPIPGLTLEWFGKAFANPGVRDALLTSMKAGVGATAIAILLGSLAALAVARYSFFGREVVSFLVILPTTSEVNGSSRQNAATNRTSSVRHRARRGGRGQAGRRRSASRERTRPHRLTPYAVSDKAILGAWSACSTRPRTSGPTMRPTGRWRRACAPAPSRSSSGRATSSARGRCCRS